MLFTVIQIRAKLDSYVDFVSRRASGELITTGKSLASPWSCSGQLLFTLTPHLCAFVHVCTHVCMHACMCVHIFLHRPLCVCVVCVKLISCCCGHLSFVLLEQRPIFEILSCPIHHTNTMPWSTRKSPLISPRNASRLLSKG